MTRRDLIALLGSTLERPRSRSAANHARPAWPPDAQRMGRWKYPLLRTPRCPGAQKSQHEKNEEYK
jgi:hypothetical protein